MSNEKRLIDANKLLRVFEPKAWDSVYIQTDTVVAEIKTAPTIDAVEVVRCKDCWKSAEGLCSYRLKDVPGKDFCGDGERKDNG